MTSARETDLPAPLAELLQAPPLEVRAWDSVNLPMIRHYCETVGIQNPLYVDEAAAKAGPHGGIVAPASMLYDWTMPGYTGRNPDVTGIDCGREAAARMTREGYSDVVAVRLQHEYYRYPRIGERLTRQANIASISNLKQTAVGEGRFITENNLFVNETGERIGRAIISFLCYRPAARASGAKVAGAAAAAPSSSDFPAISIDITTTFIIATAIATRDYQNVHHDRDAATKAGAKDIFLNILTAMGLVQRGVEQWCGNDTILESIDLSLIGQLYPGHCLSLTVNGSKRADDGRLTLQVKGDHQDGPFIQAVVTARVP